MMRRKARGAGPKRDVTCSIVAIATGMELNPKPRKPPHAHGSVVVASQEREEHQHRHGGRPAATCATHVRQEGRYGVELIVQSWRLIKLIARKTCKAISPLRSIGAKSSPESGRRRRRS